MFVRLVIQAIHIAVNVRRILGVGPFSTITKIFIYCIAMGTEGSLSQLILITIDRYVAVKHPLWYHTLITKETLLVDKLLAWTFETMITFLKIALAFKCEKRRSNLIGYGIGVSICIICFLILIYIEILRQKNRIQIEQVPREEIKRIKTDPKAAIFIILIALLLVCVPGPFVLILLVLTPRSNVLILVVYLYSNFMML